MIIMDAFSRQIIT